MGSYEICTFLYGMHRFLMGNRKVWTRSAKFLRFRKIQLWESGSFADITNMLGKPKMEVPYVPYNKAIIGVGVPLHTPESIQRKIGEYVAPF